MKSRELTSSKNSLPTGRNYIRSGSSRSGGCTINCLKQASTPVGTAPETAFNRRDSAVLNIFSRPVGWWVEAGNGYIVVVTYPLSLR